MAAMVHDIAIEQGATYLEEITLSPVVDLTGYTGECQIRATASIDSRVLAEPVVVVDILNPETGKFTLSLTDVETLALPVSGSTYASTTRYTYDVLMTSTTDVIRVLNGAVTVSPCVTRA
jgi:hypothetical protein